ncbi:hypothetical protein EYF80_008038 [Liparis tanakae]|uniref:Uncharacterized protein n=1 Tax=Liparis tanakae TaxID=230148 RepID=A0A4Z2IWE4_9TELE|nr:hypothetical protein EYF80_008038 [Liparis tanakae]
MDVGSRHLSVFDPSREFIFPRPDDPAKLRIPVVVLDWMTAASLPSLQAHRSQSERCGVISEMPNLSVILAMRPETEPGWREQEPDPQKRSCFILILRMFSYVDLDVRSFWHLQKVHY